LSLERERTEERRLRKQEEEIKRETQRFNIIDRENKRKYEAEEKEKMRKHEAEEKEKARKHEADMQQLRNEMKRLELKEQDNKRAENEKARAHEIQKINADLKKYAKEKEFELKKLK